MDKKALQLNARFALPPNSLGFCGKNSAIEKFKTCVTKSKCLGVEKELEHFITLHPYLKTISKITGNPKFSHKVAEAYWLGNDTLLKAKKKDYKTLLENFKKQGVPKSVVDEMKRNPPKKFIPTHLFQVLYMSINKNSLSPKKYLEFANNCMVRWGKVIRINKNTLKLDLCSLRISKGVYKITQKEETIPYHPGFLFGVKKGDTVAVHWNQAVKILDENEQNHIYKWSGIVLKSINSQK